MIEKYVYHTMSSSERALVMNKIREMLQKESIRLAIIFGSFIELNSFRDIDIAVYFRDEVSMDEMIKLENKLEEALGIPVDIVPLDEVEPRFRLNILRKGVVIIEEPGVYEALLMQTLDELYILSHG